MTETEIDSALVDVKTAIERPARAGDSLEFRRAALAWLRLRLAPATVELTSIDTPSTNGMSAETFFLRLCVDGAEQRFVLRREPQVNSIFLGLDNSHQATVIAALHGAGAAPVPAVIGAETDCAILGAPFFVTRFVEGRVPPDNPLYSASGWVFDLPAPDKTRLWWSGVAAMAGVAALDWRAAGLTGLRKGATCGEDAAHELDYYLKLHRDGCNGIYAEHVLNAERWLRAHWPSDSPAALSWGDARLGNMIFQETECAAIVDWEQSGIGAVERDLAWWFYIDTYYHEGLGIDRAPGWPSHRETEQEYARLTGAPLADLVFYKAFAAFRSSVISARFAALGLIPHHPVEDFVPARVFDRFARQG